MKLFGQLSARAEGDEHVETPVGHCCRYCDQPIAADDRGVFVQFFAPDRQSRLVPEHYECFMRQIIGSVAHQERRCSCFGKQDPPEPNRREAARAALAVWQRNQPDTHTHTHTRNNHAIRRENVVYHGLRKDGTPAVFYERDGHHAALSAVPSLRLRNHSPTGFEWGYAGSGPAQLSLAILLHFTGDKEIALGHYQRFKREVICVFRRPAWKLTGQQIADWFVTNGICLLPRTETDTEPEKRKTP